MCLNHEENQCQTLDTKDITFITQLFSCALQPMSFPRIIWYNDGTDALILSEILISIQL